MDPHRHRQLPALLATMGLLLAVACSDGGSASTTVASSTTIASAATAPATTTIAAATTAPATTTIAAATTEPATTDPAPIIEPTTTTQPDTSIAVSYAYVYSPPDGNVDDLLDHFPASPPDPSNGKLGLFSAHGMTQATGDLAGTMWYVFGSNEHPTGFASGGITAVSISLFSGTVTACGTGTAVIAESTTYPAGGDGQGVWRVLDGYGTGELAKMTGSGTTVRRDGLDAGDGEVTARISCDGSYPGPDAPAPIGRPVSFSWGYQGADNVSDAGGVPWQQAYDQSVVADPATGKLGLVHGWLVLAGTRVELTQFVGTVAGCGQGTMIVLGTASFGPGTNNPEDRINADYTWSILLGFGTGDLQSATGHGTGVTSENSSGGTATLEGKVSCSS